VEWAGVGVGSSTQLARSALVAVDLVVRGGEVHDGTGADPVRADVLVREGRIAAIARGSGRVLAPDAAQRPRRRTPLRRARARGLRTGQDVALDMHTRPFGFTFLATALPAWALEGGPARLGELLADRDARARMSTHRSIFGAGGDWSRVVLLDNPFWPGYARRDLASIAADRGQEPFDAVCDLLQAAPSEQQALMASIRCYTEEQQAEAFADPLCMPCTDATTLAPDGPLAGSVFHGAYTWATWFYRFMTRERKLLTPAEAIRRLTGLPARRLGLADRGVLRVGAPADLAVFDPALFAEQGSEWEPNRLAAGMRHVVVNGTLTLADGALTGARGGRVLRRR